MKYERFLPMFSGEDLIESGQRTVATKVYTLEFVLSE